MKIDKKYCPNCGCDTFKGTFMKTAAIKLGDELQILKEGTVVAFNAIECAKCNAKVTNDTLLETVGTPCKTCGELNNPAELVEGECRVCLAKNSRDDIKNASESDLIKRILELESKLANASSEDKDDSEKEIKSKEKKTTKASSTSKAKKSETKKETSSKDKEKVEEKIEEKPVEVKSEPVSATTEENIFDNTPVEKVESNSVVQEDIFGTGANIQEIADPF